MTEPKSDAARGREEATMTAAQRSTTSTHVTDIPTGITYEFPGIHPAELGGTGGVVWSADPARSVLLVHDMQDHFVDKYQREADPIRSAISRVRELVETARGVGVPVVFSAQPGDQDPQERGLLKDFWGDGPCTVGHRSHP